MIEWVIADIAANFVYCYLSESDAGNLLAFAA